MTSADWDRRRRHQRNWGGDWHGRGWGGELRATAWNNNHPWDDPQNTARDTGRWDGQDAGRWDGRDTGRDDGRGDVPRKRVRIGDAERDRAVAVLSEHFVAGRLTQAEFEERSEVVTRARYADDLEPLFDDLPSSTELQAVPGRADLRRRPGPPPPFLMLAPFLMVGLVITSVALTAPWLLWGMFWIVLISGMSRRHWHHHR
ncbi:DUF1707 SHOCT-like domain-containing protein [Kribbella speibonae]|uniref:DUF1707 domain-containing protein n=1 Tax=Kribbella speibonae TaxID=1572660 RepID=A0ABY1ZT32_9ACTN|nr:DUF1707 domain-containing protein [Kribbella speibonae]TCC16667.1 DUF1707 domain-containing protein [Kribbella speibonae]